MEKFVFKKPRLNVSDGDGVIAQEDNVDEQVSNVITFQHSANLIFVIVGRNVTTVRTSTLRF
jgi:hypothetical protein